MPSSRYLQISHCCTNTNAACLHESQNTLSGLPTLETGRERDYGHELFLPGHFGQHQTSPQNGLTWQQQFYAPGMCFCDRDDTRQLAGLNISLKGRGHWKSDIKQLSAKLFLHCPGYNNILCFHRRLQFSVWYFLEKIKLKPSVTQDVVWLWHTDSDSCPLILRLRHSADVSFLSPTRSSHLLCPPSSLSIFSISHICSILPLLEVKGLLIRRLLKLNQ